MKLSNATLNTVNEGAHARREVLQFDGRLPRIIELRAEEESLVFPALPDQPSEVHLLDCPRTSLNVQVGMVLRHRPRKNQFIFKISLPDVHHQVGDRIYHSSYSDEVLEFWIKCCKEFGVIFAVLSDEEAGFDDVVPGGGAVDLHGVEAVVVEDAVVCPHLQQPLQVVGLGVRAGRVQPREGPVHEHGGRRGVHHQGVLVQPAHCTLLLWHLVLLEILEEQSYENYSIRTYTINYI